MTRLELADMLEQFVDDQSGSNPWFFDDFTSTSISADLRPFQTRLREMDPPLDNGETNEIRAMIRELRTGAVE
ncbi:MAG TPA: hypothetical protein VF098_11870 [Sphingomicrobium sp.]|jgi:hypothetical protein